MKVERNSSSRPARSVAPLPMPAGSRPPAGVDADRTRSCRASVLGIPEAEFTPRVRDAIMGLMSEVDSLRRELTQTRARLDEVEKTADQDACCRCSTAAPLCAS